MIYTVNYTHTATECVQVEEKSAKAALESVRKWLARFQGANGGTHFYTVTGVQESEAAK